MKRLLAYLIIIFSFLLSGNAYADNLKIVDGDTIHLNGEKIRFTGIDTPELKQTCIKDGAKDT